VKEEPSPITGFLVVKEGCKIGRGKQKQWRERGGIDSLVLPSFPALIGIEGGTFS